MADKLEPVRYKNLVREIGELYENARRTLAQTYWQIGRKIVEGEQHGTIRARYGDKLLEHLSEDLSKIHGPGFSLSNLKRIRKFYLLNRKGARVHLLTWGKQVELLPVMDSKKREQLGKRAQQEGLSRDKLRELVNKEKAREKFEAGPSAPLKLLTPLWGRLYTHRIVKKGGELYLDFGFRNYQRLTASEAGHFKEGDIVELRADGGLRKAAEASAKDLYTYEAALDRVYDADTQWYFIFKGRHDLHLMRNDKLRLRGIDAPELDTAAGRAAKKFVQELFRRSVGVTVTTTKPDKFDRYLSDIFLKQPDGTEIFLNNELLKHGHARLYDDPKPQDWGD